MSKTSYFMRPLALLVLAAVAASVMMVVLASPAQAAIITVDSTADDADPADGECTLREAITAANTDTASGTATGECAAGSGDDGINIGLSGAVNLTGALPDLSTNLVIAGPGADEFTVRRETGGGYRIFTVTSGSVVSISGITVSGGNTPFSSGGGIYNDSGTLTIISSTISGNSALTGGGIHNREGILTVSDSTISGNSATLGGGVFSDTFLSGMQKTTIANSTISGNSALLRGGGVINFDGLTEIEHSTITNNSAPSGQGSGVASFGQTDTRTEVLSTIISANPGTDVNFTDQTTNSFDSNGYNLIGTGNATGAFNQTGDQTGVTNPGLGALANNGGPTQTHALLTGSPAVDAIPQGTNGCGTTFTQDQRGVSRPQASACDIGSFELEKPPDTEAPRVISTFPRGGGEVGPAASIRATFSEDMREASVINAFKLFRKGSTNQIAATVTYDAETDTATLNPTNDLRRGATYKAVVTTVAKDEAGNRLDQNSSKAGLQQKVWFFEVD